MSKLEKFRSQIIKSSKIENKDVKAILAWLEKKNKENKMRSRKVPINKLNDWNVKTNGNIARIHVEYKSQQIQVTKDQNDEVVEGDLNQILSIKEIWIFSKKLNSKSPIWALEEILDV